MKGTTTGEMQILQYYFEQRTEIICMLATSQKYAF